jgi:type IV secretory pathway VirB2 component (pilin)
MVLRRRAWTIELTFLLWATAGRATAWAAVAGSGLPWDTPLLTVSNALWGTPAHAIMTAVIVFAGLAWAFTDHQIGARRVFAGAMGGALAVNAPDVMNALGWGGALF